VEDFTIELLEDYKYKPSIAISAPYTGDDKKHWTDGYMLLRRDCITRPIKRMYEHTSKYQRRVRVSKDSIKRLWDYQWGNESEKALTPELVRVSGFSNRYQRQTVMLQTENGRSVLLCADKVKFLMMKIKDCSFYIPKDDKFGAVQIKSGNKRAGLIMPMRM